MNRLRVLVGGVPFGCDNIGDEAILKANVDILREVTDGNVSITVATGAQDYTRSWLGVETCELFGHDSSANLSRFSELLGKHDLFYWAGATGLSDYPEVPLRLIRTAKDKGVPTVMFAVGMNRYFNPHIYRLNTYGGRLGIFRRILKWVTFGAWDLSDTYYAIKASKIRSAIREALSGCSLLVARDKQTRDELLSARIQREVLVAADPAIETSAKPIADGAWPQEFKEYIQSVRGKKKIGLCISSQSKISEFDELSQFFGEFCKKTDSILFLVPMNPKTDRECMDQIYQRLKNSIEVVQIPYNEDPSEITGLASELSVLVSSRLHLLILGASAGTPIVGITRGEKIPNFLSEFGLKPAGSVEKIDFHVLRQQIEEVFRDPIGSKEKLNQVLREQRARLKQSKQSLQNYLGSLKVSC